MQFICGHPMKRSRRAWHPTPVFLPGESHGWRSLAGYSPWGCKESDMTERHHFTSQERESKHSPLPSFAERSKRVGAKREAAPRVHAEQSRGVPSSFRTKEPGLSPRWAETCLSRTGPPTNGHHAPLSWGVRRSAPHTEAEAAPPPSWAVLTSPCRSDPYKGKKPACPWPRPGPAGQRQPLRPLPRVPGAWWVTGRKSQQTAD